MDRICIITCQCGHNQCRIFLRSVLVGLCFVVTDDLRPCVYLRGSAREAKDIYSVIFLSRGSSARAVNERFRFRLPETGYCITPSDRVWSPTPASLYQFATAAAWDRRRMIFTRGHAKSQLVAGELLTSPRFGLSLLKQRSDRLRK